MYWFMLFVLSDCCGSLALSDNGPYLVLNRKLKLKWNFWLYKWGKWNIIKTVIISNVVSSRSTSNKTCCYQKLWSFIEQMNVQGAWMVFLDQIQPLSF